MNTFRDAIEVAKANNSGQFHVFDDKLYHSTWHSFRTAIKVSDGQPNGQVFNTDGKLISPA